MGGLICIEMLKLLQGKKKEDFKNGTCNYANNTFQMAEPLGKHLIQGEGEDVEKPDPTTLGADAFDEGGSIKPEHFIVKPWVAIPSPHNKWMTMELEAGLTLKGLREFLAAQEINLQAWSVNVPGTKEAINLVDVSAQGNVDDALLTATAPVDLDLHKATVKIMTCAEIADKQNYISRWKELQPDKVAQREEFEARLLQSLLAEDGQQDLAGKTRFQLDVLLMSNGKFVKHPPLVLNLQ